MKKITCLFVFISFFLNLKAQNSNFIAEKIWKPESLKNARFGKFYYLILEFDQIPSLFDQQKMAEEGVFLQDYREKNQFWAKVKVNISSEKIEKWQIKNAFVLPFQQKTSGQFFSENGKILADVLVFKDIQWAEIEADCAELGIKLLQDQSVLQVFSLEIPSENLDKLATKAWLMHLSPSPKNILMNDIGRNQSRSNVLSDGIRNLNGKGIKIGVFDGGNVGNHIDFGLNRIKNKESVGVSAHATHIVGILAGSGNLDPRAKGTVNQAQIFAYQYEYVPFKMYQAVQNQQISITQNSYGNNPTCNNFAPYIITNRQEDMLVNLFPHLVHVFAIGNSQRDCTGGFGSTAGQSAKNTITVGAVYDNDSGTNFSSWGPVRDGRIKPDLVTLGRGYYSTFPNQNYYTSGDGTSQACPAVSGVVAQLQERYKQMHDIYPPASLIKAVLCNTAKDLGNPYPDFKFGFGRINAISAVKSLEEKRFEIKQISANQKQIVDISMPEGATKLKVLIAWSDPAAMPESAKTLINDLDLQILEKQTSSVFLPWILDPAKPNSTAVRGVDKLNNIEQITIENPKGNYQILISAENLPTGTQEYSLTWQIEKPFLEVTYPSGNEKLWGEQIFRWDSEGISGNYKVEFSGNNGATWDLLGENIANNITQSDFIVPARITTSKALMRVSSGNISAVSATNFQVFTAVIDLKITGSNNQAIFSWNKINEASSYDLLKLNLEKEVWETIASKIDATSYQLGNLPNGKEMWFAVQARQDLTGTVGQRSLAKNIILSGGGANTDLELQEILNSTENECLSPRNDEIISVKIRNKSSSALSAGVILPLSYQIDNQEVVRENLTLNSNLEVEKSMVYNFTQKANFRNSESELRAQVSFASDLILGNNELKTKIFSQNLMFISAFGEQECNSAANLYVSGFPLRNYQMSNINFAPQTLPSAKNINLKDNQISEALPIGFPFNFYGNVYTKFYVSNDGFLTFSGFGLSNFNSSATSPMATNDLINNVIAAVWADLNPDAGGKIQYDLLGSFPNRKLVVSFENVPFWAEKNVVAYATSQIILYEGSNAIEIHSTDVQTDGKTKAVMGIENLNGKYGVAVDGRNNSFWTAQNDAKRFVPDIKNLIWNNGESTFFVNTVANNSISAVYTDDNCKFLAKIASPCVINALENDRFLGKNLIYPNPTNNSVKIEVFLEKRSTLNLKLLNLLGQNIYEKHFSAKNDHFEEEFDLSFLPNGVYILQIITEFGQKMDKILKE